MRDNPMRRTIAPQLRKPVPRALTVTDVHRLREVQVDARDLVVGLQGETVHHHGGLPGQVRAGMQLAHDEVRGQICPALGGMGQTFLETDLSAHRQGRR